MAVAAAELIKQIDRMTVLELNTLVKELEEHYGVSAAAAVPMASAVDGGEAEEVEEQTEFDVLLASFGDKKIAVIKAVREVTRLGLREAKDLVESAPVAVKEGVSKEEADQVKSKIEAAGGQAEVK